MSCRGRARGQRLALAALVNGDGMSGVRPPRYSHSVVRGLAVLCCFTAERPVLGVADIAHELGMSRSVTHRYVTRLVALGVLEQDASRMCSINDDR